MFIAGSGLFGREVVRAAAPREAVVPPIKATAHPYHGGTAKRREPPLLADLTAEHARLHAIFWAKKDKKIAAQLPKRLVTSEPATQIKSSLLDPRLTFANFIAGDSSQLAFIEAQRCAMALKTFYNPLFLHGAVGLGKTHLLQAIAQRAATAGRRVCYLTSEQFAYGFVRHLMNENSAFSFREQLRDIDLLLIDDVQFLQGKAIQQQLSLVLDCFLNNARQIVIAADRPPGDLEMLEERVRSRMSGGLCIEIGALDEAGRVKIIETRISAAKWANPTFEVPDDVVAYVAGAVQTNGRDLDGAVNRLLARFLMKCPMSLEVAEIAVRDLIRAPEQKKVKVEDIQKLVASHFNVSRADMLSHRRTANVVRPRQIAMYLAKLLTPRSLPEIARRFGGRDHTTVLHAVRKMDRLVAEDGTVAAEIATLREMLTT